jgi:hypothetical protein
MSLDAKIRDIISRSTFKKGIESGRYVTAVSRGLFEERQVGKQRMRTPIRPPMVDADGLPAVQIIPNNETAISHAKHFSGFEVYTPAEEPKAVKKAAPRKSTTTKEVNNG